MLFRSLIAITDRKKFILGSGISKGIMLILPALNCCRIITSTWFICLGSLPKWDLYGRDVRSGRTYQGITSPECRRLNKNFPCWPGKWDASLKGLRALGGFIVSAEFYEGKLISVLIESTVPKTITILSPREKVSVNGRQIIRDENRLIIFKTTPGDKYLLYGVKLKYIMLFC